MSNETTRTDRSNEYLTYTLLKDGWEVFHVRNPKSQFIRECEGELILFHDGEEFKRYDLSNAADLRARCERLATEAAG